MLHRAETIGSPYPAPLRAGSRDEVPCRGAGREPRKHDVSRRNDRLTLLRIIAEKGQGAKSLAGVRGGSPASAAHRAEAIGFPYPARKIRGAKQGQRKAWRACIMAMPRHSDGARTVIFPLSRAAFARYCLKKSREILEFSVWFRTVYLRIPRNGGGVRPRVPW